MASHLQTSSPDRPLQHLQSHQHPDQQQEQLPSSSSSNLPAAPAADDQPAASVHPSGVATAPSTANAVAPPTKPGTAARAARSRRDRPCDACRTAKRRCFQNLGEACVACKSSGLECTFLEPPSKRRRGSDGGGDRQQHQLQSELGQLDDIKPMKQQRLNATPSSSLSGAQLQRKQHQQQSAAASNALQLDPHQQHLQQQQQAAFAGLAVAGPGPQTAARFAHVSNLAAAAAAAATAAASSAGPHESPGGSNSINGNGGGGAVRSWNPSLGSGGSPGVGGGGAASPTMGPLHAILNRVRSGTDYAQSERSTFLPIRGGGSGCHGAGGGGRGGGGEGAQASPGSAASMSGGGDQQNNDEDDLAHPTLDSSRFDASEPHFVDGSSAVDDPSLLPSRVREVAGGASIGDGADDSSGSGAAADKVFFVQIPSLIYGSSGAGRDALWGHGSGLGRSNGGLERAMALLGESWPTTLLQTFFDRTLPAFPIINVTRMRHLVETADPTSALYPSRILCAILAHAIIYYPPLRSLQEAIFSEVYEFLQTEFLQPRLQTLQLTILDLASRAEKNPGGNTIALGRAIGAAQLLGLHLDCSKWKLPKWERSLRKRLWWSLYILDKWHSLYQGRPSLIHRDNWNALLLSIDDFDPPAPTTATPGSTTSGGGSHVQLSQPAIDSADSFIALSSLTLILDDILAEFFTCRAQARAAAGVGPRGKGSSRAGRSSRLRVIESFGGDLDRFQRELKPGVKAGSREGSVVPTGIKSMQLCYLGLTIVLGRLTLDLFDPEDPGDAQDVSAAVESSLDLCEAVVHFVENLDHADLTEGFWVSFSHSHLSNALSLLIRSLLASKRISATVQLARASSLLERFIIILALLQREPICWDVAERALAKALALLPSVSKLVPEVGKMWSAHSPGIWTSMRKSATADVLLKVIPEEATYQTRRGGGRSGDGPNGPGGMPSSIPLGQPQPHLQQAHLQPQQEQQQRQQQQQKPHQVQMPHQVHSSLSGYNEDRNASHMIGAGAVGGSQQPIYPVGVMPPFTIPAPTGSRPGGVPAAPEGLDVSFQTIVGEEDLWATLGDREGFSWMGLGFGTNL